MSHGAAPVFTPLEIAEVRAETPLLTHLALAGATPEFLGAYKIPGQYIQVKAGDHKPGFFAIASGPGESRIELLIKRGSPLADAIVAKSRGETLDVSAPAGKGYPFDAARGQDLFLVGVGSGIAPLRAVMHAVLKDRAAFKRVVFVYGVRGDCDFPYLKEMDAWAAAGIEVSHVCSQPAANAWKGRAGRVQDVLLSRPVPVSPGSCAFICGMRPMVEDVKNAFATLGIPPDRVYQNF